MNRSAIPADIVWVRCDSHRARQRLERLVGASNVIPRYEWTHDRRTGHTTGTIHFYGIPPQHEAEALAITSVRHYRPRGEHCTPW